jgi:predicted RNase H-like HicB family nuclease
VIIETGETSSSVSVPGLPGCVAVGAMLQEVKPLIRDAIAFHLEDLQWEGLPIPPPTTFCRHVEVWVP